MPERKCTAVKVQDKRSLKQFVVDAKAVIIMSHVIPQFHYVKRPLAEANSTIYGSLTLSFDHAYSIWPDFSPLQY